MSDENIEVTEIESPFLQRVGEKLYSYKFPTKASIVSMEDGTSVESAVSSAQETLGDVTAEQLAEAVADSHTHENKDDVLDALGVNSDGKLTFNGTVVAGSGSGSGGGDSGDTGALTEEVEELKEQVEAQQTVISSLTETVEAQATTITNLAGQIEALQSDLEAYMKKANDQFTAGYYGTVVEMESASSHEVDPTLGSVFVIHNAEAEAAVSISGAVGAACVTVMFDNAAMTEDAALTWGDSIMWPDGDAPAEVEAGAVGVYTFITPDAGATWYGVVNGYSFGVEE